MVVIMNQQFLDDASLQGRADDSRSETEGKVKSVIKDQGMAILTI
jgi:hypothetical protein